VVKDQFMITEPDAGDRPFYRDEMPGTAAIDPSDGRTVVTFRRI